MSRKLISLAIAAVLPGIFASGAYAQSSTGGDVTTNTRVGAVLQNNVGIGNTDKASVGGAVGASVGGSVNSAIAVGAVLQNNVGIGSTNKVSIGSMD